MMPSGGDHVDSKGSLNNEKKPAAEEVKKKRGNFDGTNSGKKKSSRRYSRAHRNRNEFKRSHEKVHDTKELKAPQGNVQDTKESKAPQGNVQDTKESKAPQGNAQDTKESKAPQGNPQHTKDSKSPQANLQDTKDSKTPQKNVRDNKESKASQGNVQNMKKLKTNQPEKKTNINVSGEAVAVSESKASGGINSNVKLGEHVGKKSRLQHKRSRKRNHGASVNKQEPIISGAVSGAGAKDIDSTKKDLDTSGLPVVQKGDVNTVATSCATSQTGLIEVGNSRDVVNNDAPGPVDETVDSTPDQVYGKVNSNTASVNLSVSKPHDENKPVYTVDPELVTLLRSCSCKSLITFCKQRKLTLAYMRNMSGEDMAKAGIHKKYIPKLEKALAKTSQKSDESTAIKSMHDKVKQHIQKFILDVLMDLGEGKFKRVPVEKLESLTQEKLGSAECQWLAGTGGMIVFLRKFGEIALRDKDKIASLKRPVDISRESKTKFESVSESETNLKSKDSSLMKEIELVIKSSKHPGRARMPIFAIEKRLDWKTKHLKDKGPLEKYLDDKKGALICKGGFVSIRQGSENKTSSEGTQQSESRKGKTGLSAISQKSAKFSMNPSSTTASDKNPATEEAQQLAKNGGRVSEANLTSRNYSTNAVSGKVASDRRYSGKHDEYLTNKNSRNGRSKNDGNERGEDKRVFFRNSAEKLGSDTRLFSNQNRNEHKKFQPRQSRPTPENERFSAQPILKRNAGEAVPLEEPAPRSQLDFVKDAQGGIFLLKRSNESEGSDSLKTLPTDVSSLFKAESTGGGTAVEQVGSPLVNESSKLSADSESFTPNSVNATQPFRSGVSSMQRVQFQRLEEHRLMIQKQLESQQQQLQHLQNIIQSQRQLQRLNLNKTENSNDIPDTFDRRIPVSETQNGSMVGSRISLPSPVLRPAASNLQSAPQAPVAHHALSSTLEVSHCSPSLEPQRPTIPVPHQSPLLAPQRVSVSPHHSPSLLSAKGAPYQPHNGIEPSTDSWASKIGKDKRSRVRSLYGLGNGHSTVALSPLGYVETPARADPPSSLSSVKADASNGYSAGRSRPSMRQEFLSAEAAAKEVASADFPSLQSAVLADKMK